MTLDAILHRASTPETPFYLKVSTRNSCVSLPVEAIIPSLIIDAPMPPEVYSSEPKKSLPQIYLKLEPPSLLVRDLPLTFTLRYAEELRAVQVTEKAKKSSSTITTSNNPVIRQNSKGQISVRVNELSSNHARKKFVIEIATANPHIPIVTTTPFSVKKTKTDSMKTANSPIPVATTTPSSVKKRKTDSMKRQRTDKEVTIHHDDHVPSPPSEFLMQSDEEVMIRDIHQMAYSNLQLANEVSIQITSILETLHVN